MTLYQVPVIRKELDIYEVEASTERAAVVAATFMMAAEEAPTFTKLQSRIVLQPTRDRDRFEPAPPEGVQLTLPES